MNKVHLLNLDGESVAVFGSARIKNDNVHFHAAYNFGKRMSDLGYNILTGGGPGIMLAANKGCFDGKNGTSVGFKIQLDGGFEDTDIGDKYHHITLRNEFFHFRQTALIENADHYVAFCGGVGTEFEILNVLTLMQCNHIPRGKVYLYDTSHWDGFMKRLRYLANVNLINKNDLDLVHVTNDYFEIVNLINTTA